MSKDEQRQEEPELEDEESLNDESPDTPESQDGERPVVAKLVSGLHDEAGKALRSILDRNPMGPESVERFFEIAIRILNRREVLERVLRSEFMKNVRDMQSEITEAVGLASQSDVHELRNQLVEVLEKLDTLQTTLDGIVVEVDGADE
jgi:hypothetical protein